MIRFGNSFKYLCENNNFEDPKMLVKFLNDYLAHAGSMTGDNNTHYIQWPEMLLKTYVGNCVDLSLFVYYVYYYLKTLPFKKDKYYPCILLMNIVALSKRDIENYDNPYRFFSHVVPIVRINDDYYEVNCDSYFAENGTKVRNSSFIGPFRSFEDAAIKIFGYFQSTISKYKEGSYEPFKDKQYEKYCLLYEEDMNYISNLYGKENITQRNLLNNIPKARELQNLFDSIINSARSDIMYMPIDNSTYHMIRYLGFTKYSINKNLKSSYYKTKLFKSK